LLNINNNNNQGETMSGLKIPVDTKEGVRNLDKLEQGFEDVGDEAKKAEMKAKGFKGALAKIGSPLKNLIKGFGGLKMAIIGLMGSLALGGLIKSFMDAKKTSEAFNLRLTILLGSAEAGAEMFKRMSTYASEVPFEFEAIMNSATNLAGVMQGGIDEVSEWIPLIGDLAAATNMTMEDTTGQIIRMYSAGASAADQFREKGVLSMLGFTAGVKYSLEETRTRLKEAWTEPQSKFAGATTAMAKTWSGMMSMLGDKWFEFRNMVMDSGVFTFIKTGLKAIVDLFEELKQKGDMKEFAERMGKNVLSALEGIVKGVAFMMDAFNGLKMVWLGLEAAWHGVSGVILVGVWAISRVISDLFGLLEGKFLKLGKVLSLSGKYLGNPLTKALGDAILDSVEVSKSFDDIADSSAAMADEAFRSMEITSEQLVNLASEESYYDKISGFVDNIYKKIEATSKIEIKPFIPPTLTEPTKKKEVSKSDQSLRTKFDKAYDEATLSRYDLEIKKLDELTEAYLNAGVERAKVEEWHAIKRSKILTDLELQIEKIGASMDDAFAGGMVDAFEGFLTGAKSAKEAFSEFATSFTTDILKMIAKQAILNALQSSSGGSGYGGLITGVLGAIAGKADGGNVYKGTPYIVGEKGPERFISDRGDSAVVGAGGPEGFSPKSKGRIIPNGGEAPAPKVTIANIIDPSMMSDYLNSSEGQDAVINVIASNRESLGL
jgi:hypothetical protein